MKSVGFVCSFNVGRSVIAEHLFRRILRERDRRLEQEVEVWSAALVTRELVQAARGDGMPLPRPFFGHHADPYLTRLLLSKGVDAHSHRSRPLTWEMAKKASLIITMQQMQTERALSLYPWTKGKVFRLTEFVGKRGTFTIEDMGLPEYRPESDSYSQSEAYHDACLAEIEQCLSKGIDTFAYYLRQGSACN